MDERREGHAGASARGKKGAEAWHLKPGQEEKAARARERGKTKLWACEEKPKEMNG